MKLDRMQFAYLVAHCVRNGMSCGEYEINELDRLTEVEVPVQTNHISCEDVDRLMALMAEGTQKIEAIKAYRTLTGAGLKESKGAVEKYQSSIDTRVDRMLKVLDEQINNPSLGIDYQLSAHDNSLSDIRNFINGFSK